MAGDKPSMLSKRQYRPLLTDRPEIRILVVEASQDYDAVIRCRLEAFCFFDMSRGTRNTRAYEALSYTWGDSGCPQNIIVNDEIVPVTDNLESFLRNRREKHRDIDLWVDAICINQDDNLEKNQQLPLMNLIYSFSSKLIVWLGAPADNSELAIEWLKILGEGSPYDKMPILRDEVIEAIQKLLDRPWWTRAWIVQELVAGGMGTKLSQLTVQCGKNDITWMEIVISAARMKAHQDDMRQDFPNIVNILELDSLRDSAGLFLLRKASLTTPYELLSRYRHFHASNLRDKIYAICDIFSKLPSQRLQPRYNVSVEEVYTSFARQVISSTNNLDILRHCGARSLDIPSWVPDWSAPLEWHMLPVNIPRRYLDVPWWAEPELIKQPAVPGQEQGNQPSLLRYTLHPYPDDEIEAGRQRDIRLRRLEIAAHDFGEVTDLDQIPRDFEVLNISSERPSKVRELLVQKDIVLFVKDQRCVPLDSNDFRRPQQNAVSQGEIITERRMKQWLLREIKEHLSPSPYRSAASTMPDITINSSDNNNITVGGVEWDIVDACHNGFVQNLDTDWRDTTRFMVAVGCCKALAIGHPAVAARYPRLDALLEAFWLTICAGQIPGNEEEPRLIDFSDWLPEIPATWPAVKPSVTATKSGQVTLIEMNNALKEIYSVSAEMDETGFSGYKIKSILDDEYDHEQTPKRDNNEADFEVLAASWSQQPYDLYHRPFDFLNIIPDPYWDIRQREDTLARRKAEVCRMRPIVSTLDAEAGDQQNELEDQDTAKAMRELSDKISHILRERPSMVPSGTLGKEFEKYALGRKFFITSRGYMGLGPKDIVPGDKVVVPFGSHVPFLLRRFKKDSVKSGLAVLGEGYVHGIMKGEVIEQWRVGLAEKEQFQLS